MTVAVRFAFRLAIRTVPVTFAPMYRGQSKPSVTGYMFMQSSVRRCAASQLWLFALLEWCRIAIIKCKVLRQHSSTGEVLCQPSNYQGRSWILSAAEKPRFGGPRDVGLPHNHSGLLR